MGRWKAIIPIGLALVIAIVGSIAIYYWVNSQLSPKETVKVDKEIEAVPVVVAQTDLNWGTKLTKEMLKTLPFYKESLPTGYFSQKEDLLGRVLISQLKSKDPITKSKLAPKDVTEGGLSTILKPGERAVAVEGNKKIGISGFIQPGNNVDVLVTMNDPDSKKVKTKVVLENIPVLATGTKMKQNDEGKPAPVDVYTLKVTPEQAEKLTLASSRGRLQFALRNITDKKPVLTSGCDARETMNSLKSKKIVKSSSSSSSKKKKSRYVARPHVVEVINGDNLTKLKF